ncbi:retrovirus-related pol polyprotein from type-1 retrotransposable element r2 [Plakobranchus ocellatus]|uniref:Retrovirus-related pol polyprotein from type-1 retrotransposable element r2 n=1 Tax=Plakobranchus ocellatus TaxID=259542 RepID=A0AAV4D5P6_9GAST|nr:retrovirus-related pol polyprotein from type-1 retrotransposable element r2 [Plakobranchus ocellatus]
MRNLENHPGIKVGGQNINNLRYADDTVLIAENKEDLQKLLNIVEEESRKKGLELNSKKTEVMVISRKQESPKCDIFINEVKLKQREKFKYLGTIISNDEANKRRSLVRTIRKRQATFLGHVMRREKLEHLVTKGQLEGKRSRGRQMEKITDGLATWLGPGRVTETLTAVKDWDLWRYMIANAYKQGT